MEVYFDNSATTRCYDSVKDIVVKTMTEDFGNPSAMHLKGVEAEKYVKEATKTIAGILKVQEKEILFTSGGTESDNLALIGGALANKRNGRCAGQGKNESAGSCFKTRYDHGIYHACK